MVINRKIKRKLNNSIYRTLNLTIMKKIIKIQSNYYYLKSKTLKENNNF